MAEGSLSSKDLLALIGCPLASNVFHSFITTLSSLSSCITPSSPEVKAYPDAVYLNYYGLGISFMFSPINGHKPGRTTSMSNLQQADLKLESIDVYNVDRPDPSTSTAENPKRTIANAAYSPFPSFPLSFLPTSSDPGPSRPPFSVLPTSTGKDFISALGEPSRKGGGTGPSSGSIGIWCEWGAEGLMVEFGGDEARGPQAWERGKDARWKVCTFFTRGGTLR